MALIVLACQIALVFQINMFVEVHVSMIVSSIIAVA